MKISDLLNDNAKVQTLYAVNQGASEYKQGKPKWYFTTKQEAERCAKGRGWYGSTASISTLEAIILGDFAFIVDAYNPVIINRGPEDEEQIKKTALAKLTEEEKRLLGIK